MKINKVIAKSVVFAMALSVMPFTGLTSSVYAAPTATFSGSTGIITAGGGAKFWGIAKKLKKAPNSKKASQYLKKDTNYYDIRNIQPILNNEIDLDKYYGKDVIVALGTTADFETPDNWTITEIKGADKKLKAYFSLSDTKIGKLTLDNAKTLGGTNGFISLFKSSDTGKALEQVDITAQKEAIEVKKTGGDWVTAGTLFGATNDEAVNKKLAVFSQMGTNLTFRLKGNATTWESKESSIKISPQPSAPKITIKGDKISTKKGYEFQLVNKGAALASDWTPITDPKTKDTLASLGIDGTADKDLYMRIGSSTKKTASKHLKIAFSKQTALEYPESKAADTTITDAGAPQLIKVEGLSIETKIPYNIKKGAKITNALNDDYEFYISWDGNENPNPKWILLKGKTNNKGVASSMNLKYSATNKAGAYSDQKNSKLFLRKAGTTLKNGTMTLPTPALSYTMKLADKPQTLTVSASGASTANVAIAGDKNVTIHSITAKTPITHTLKIKVTNVHVKGKKPTFKYDKKNGIKLTVGEFTEVSNEITSGEADLTIEIPESAFPDVENLGGPINVEVKYEGLQDKFTVSFSKTAKSG